MGQDTPQSCQRCAPADLGVSFRAAAVKLLSQRLPAPPPASLDLKLGRGARPEGQPPGPGLCAVEGQPGRSPLRPTLERGPHQGSELRLLGLHIRSLTAASAFRHLVRRPGPAGPDIRLAHGVLWAAPTHARKHARARARCRRQLPPLLPAPTPPPPPPPGAGSDGRGLDARRRGPQPPGYARLLREERPQRCDDVRRSGYRPALGPSRPRAILVCGVILVLNLSARSPPPALLGPLGAIPLSARPPKCEVESPASAAAACNQVHRHIGVCSVRCGPAINNCLKQGPARWLCG